MCVKCSQIVMHVVRQCMVGHQNSDLIIFKYPVQMVLSSLLKESQKIVPSSKLATITLLK